MAKNDTSNKALPSPSAGVLVSPEFNAAMRALTQNQAAFVREYLRTGHGRNSAIAAGYNTGSAGRSATRLLHDHPGVREAIRLARADLAQSTVYDTSRAMSEFDAAAALAIKTENANALVRCVEMRSRLHGLIREKADITVATVDVSGAIADARARVGRGRTIDAEVVGADIFED